MMRAGACRVSECTGRVHGRGYCATHYRQWLRTGQHPDFTTHEGMSLILHLVKSIFRLLGHDQEHVITVTLTRGSAVVVLRDGTVHLHRWDST